MTHSDGTVLANGTYSGGRVSHVGQLFFNQSLITEVQSTGVYADNSIRVTTNEDDSIALQPAADDFDPFVQYVKLGESVEDGHLAWISVGVDMTNDNSVTAAGAYTGSDGTTTPSGGTAAPAESGSTSATDVSSAAADIGNGALRLELCYGWLLALALVLLQ